MQPGLRSRLELVCKWGIRLEGGYKIDTTPEWMWTSLNNYLTLFNTSYVDIFMLHNPDPNMVSGFPLPQTFAVALIGAQAVIRSDDDTIRS